MGSEGSYAEEIPQISDMEDELKNAEASNGFWEDFSSIAQEALTNEESSISLECQNGDLSGQMILNKNGEQSDIVPELKISLNNESGAENKSDSSECCENSTTTGFILRDIKILTSTPLQLSESENVLQAENIFPVLEDAASDVLDDIIDRKVFSPSSDKIETLDDTIDEAIENHLKSEDSSTCSRESGLKCDRGDEFREVSVQTTVDNSFITGDSCPICKLQREDINNLKALCLEYPPYKKRRVADSSDGAENTSNVGYNYDEDIEDGEGTQLKRKRTISQDQVVPTGEIIKGLENCYTESSSRTIRLGLSKRAKPRPLHQVTKFQAKGSTETDS